MNTILVALSANESAQEGSSARKKFTCRHHNLGSSICVTLEKLHRYGCTASIIIVEGSEELTEESVKKNNKENWLSIKNKSREEKRSITLEQ